MESILCIDTPVQMISCTDTNGKITPMRFRFRDRNGELITIHIVKIVSTDQEHSQLGANLYRVFIRHAEDIPSAV